MSAMSRMAGTLLDGPIKRRKIGTLAVRRNGVQGWKIGARLWVFLRITNKLLSYAFACVLRVFASRLAMVSGEPLWPGGFQESRKRAWPVAGSVPPRSVTWVSETQTESPPLT